MMQVIINNTTPKKIPTKKKFQSWVNAATPKKIPQTEIHIIVVNEKKSAALNKTYRHKKGPTNILSFFYNKAPGISNASLGDLIICESIVNKEARAQQKTLTAHWAHLTVHGMLHLLGYDHIKEKDAAIMEKLEITILKKLGIKNPYA
ncbi:MAG: hypothetical protein ACD_42C00578G0003 [uncultured bacterium]|nr:MAG: hypothetical protein ACD_42C00578G0003 [uncultured bacterium]OGT26776.1 MAG: rRNA maturation RNase YbeY [Gammaproteobacteria bacterium RIFCSPHIGHO2_02_FULL_42_43]OGT28656.1 MAG: rRNA maturation RNase YbeY [Gammaproteobacteria bacterium RIFCSPHIGHO2_01_FULL_42_8]OGT52916.1 MAG: rRNA maturation RNase YbeY [Gammaproteobacteria bacterium RIFCSPHIGHO2_12_FULL_41_25]OGT61310.1 MAG: rRNA maturation RNase YbeY [Gammaproteobacteria bacterium RIFCSPLOWO2_02_FULL_42_14]OGT87239.1 MAG: rRNA matura